MFVLGLITPKRKALLAIKRFILSVRIFSSRLNEQAKFIICGVAGSPRLLALRDTPGILKHGCRGSFALWSSCNVKDRTSRAKTTIKHICYLIVGIPPSCCIMRRASRSAHCSAILPPTKRKKSVPVNVTSFPVGGKTLKGPLMHATPGVANRDLVPLSNHVFGRELEIGEG